MHGRMDERTTGFCVSLRPQDPYLKPSIFASLRPKIHISNLPFALHSTPFPQSGYHTLLVQCDLHRLTQFHYGPFPLHSTRFPQSGHHTLWSIFASLDPFSSILLLYALDPNRSTSTYTIPLWSISASLDPITSIRLPYAFCPLYACPCLALPDTRSESHLFCFPSNHLHSIRLVSLIPLLFQITIKLSLPQVIIWLNLLHLISFPYIYYNSCLFISFNSNSIYSNWLIFYLFYLILIQF